MEMFGKSYDSIGSTNSNFIIKTKGDLKVQWGNKFITLIKNGKIAQESTKLLNIANSIDDITKDGIYLIDDLVWVVIDGTKVQLNSSSDTFISYLVDQELTSDNKDKALVNIGFYYNTLEEARLAQAGLIFVKETNKLYLVKDGQVSEYTSTVTSTSEEVLKQPLYIESTSIFLNGDEYIKCDNNKIEVFKPLISRNMIQSPDATDQTGFRLYVSEGLSILEVDKVLTRTNIDNQVQIYPIKYFQEEVLITRMYVSNSTFMVVTTPNSIELGDTFVTYITKDNIILLVIIKIISKVIDTTFEISYTSTKDINISDLVNKQLYYAAGNRTLLRIKNSNLDLLEPTSLEDEETIKTRVGDISELKVLIDEKGISDFTEKTQGIYSDNAILNESTIVKSSLYDIKFKTLKDKYPVYDESLNIPTNDYLSELYNKSVPNIQWIKEILKFVIPPGTIVMWSGGAIPNGWAICDGSNGTPNLIGRFIKADSSSGATDVYQNNEFTLKEEHLPKHEHPHQPHYHSIPSLGTDSAGGYTVVTGISYSNTTVASAQEGASVSAISSVDTGTTSSHSHDTYTDNTGESTSKETEKVWTNKSFKIEPNYYSLIFIMKLDYD